MAIKLLDDDYFVSKQIATDEVAELKAAGIKTIICNRPDREEAGQPDYSTIEKKAAALNIDCHYIPITKGGITEPTLAHFKELYARLPKPVLAYCRSGNRSATLWSLAKGEQLGLDYVLKQTAAAGFDMSHLSPRITKK